jgi:hypothetical protein
MSLAIGSRCHMLYNRLPSALRRGDLHDSFEHSGYARDQAPDLDMTPREKMSTRAHSLGLFRRSSLPLVALSRLNNVFVGMRLLPGLVPGFGLGNESAINRAQT